MSHQLFGTDFAHQRAVASIMEAAPSGTIRDIINEIFTQAKAANIPWMKIFMAVATAAAGGFTPASIAAAIAMLFGSNPPASLKAHAASPPTL